MKFKLTPKKSVIFLIVIVLVLVAGGIFLWQRNRLTPIDKWESAKVSQRKDYIVKETPEGKLIENKKAGISFRIPKGWVLESYDMPYVSFHTSDAVFNEKRNDILKKGCNIDVYIEYIRTNIETVKEQAKKSRDQMRSSSVNSRFILDPYKEIKIDNYNGLKYNTEIKSLKMFDSVIFLPTKNTLCKISLINPISEKDRCIQEFNEFLKTISVK